MMMRRRMMTLDEEIKCEQQYERMYMIDCLIEQRNELYETIRCQHITDCDWLMYQLDEVNDMLEIYGYFH